ncbi:DUF1559 domain-containing protein [Aeoliella mucimassa]|uniref:Type II secretion system protein G n=1 Tax=Aeoliella mucimassa TaxID=2527972 RepID=A0A518AK25_9BACT|nr:DUF1559 domain-containing protein [Aeoliella mucimassa]QDU55034.1 Type II secretion system protein G precursor [Aeoliella mucimassa]
MACTWRYKRGFTLVELLVVIAIIGILVALLLPAVQAAREAARRIQCTNQLKQIALAIQNYSDTNKCYPQGRAGCDGASLTDAANAGLSTSGWDNSRSYSGFVQILPFMEQGALYDAIDLDHFWSSPGVPERIGDDTHSVAHQAIVATVIEAYNCPSDSRPKSVDWGNGPEAVGSYALCMGSNGPTYGWASLPVKVDNTGVFLYARKIKPRQITDGLSRTMFVGETIDGHEKATSNRWTAAARHQDSLRSTENPLNTPPGYGTPYTAYGYTTNGAFASRHPDGGLFAFGDGHVEFLNDSIDIWTYRTLSTRANGDLEGIDDTVDDTPTPR